MRRTKSIVSKLASAVGMTLEELESSLRSDPTEQFGLCWHGARQVSHEGRPQSTLRLLFELKIGEPLGSNRRLRSKLCPNAGCLNPNHYRARTYQTWRERFCSEPGPEPIDMAALYAEAHDPAIQAASAFNDVCDLVSSGDGGRTRSAADLHDQWPMFDLELFERALIHLGQDD